MKRMTALILALILMLSVLPLASFAATGYTKTYTMLKPNDLSNTEIAKRGDLGFWKQLSVKRKQCLWRAMAGSSRTAKGFCGCG